MQGRVEDHIEQSDHENLKKQTRVKKHVEQIKGFFTHAALYVIINTIITLIKIVGTSYYGESFMGPIWHFSTIAPWLFWGIGLMFHALKVFGLNPLFNKDWEERQIQKYMKEDQEESEKYN